MKNIFFNFSFSTFFILSVFTFSAHASTSVTNKHLQLDKNIDEYKSLVKEVLEHRTKAIDIAKRLKKKTELNQPLSGKDLDKLNQGMVTGLNLRKKVLCFAYKYKLSPKTFDQPEKQLKCIMLCLSASLMLYDNYLVMVSIFEEDETLRRFLNEQDSGYKIRENQLAEIAISYNSARKRARVRDAMKFYENQKELIDFSKDKDLEYLEELINQSFSYNMTRKFSPLFIVGKKIKFMRAISKDSLKILKKDGINLFSKLFGNSVGKVATRKGKLFNRKDVFWQLTNQLCAGDILLEKTPFRLTDKFIPGHWGHAAIWIGTEKELEKLGIWNHPIIIPYHEKIKNGHGVIEALRSGVQLNSLQHFLDIDDVAIVRCPKLNSTNLAERIILSFRQIGKDYDFNFDVETTDKIVCSELIYTVYVDIDWPTEEALGRHTISPDHVAERTLSKGPLKLVTFYHDGKIVTNSPLLLMEKLIKEK